MLRTIGMYSWISSAESFSAAGGNFFGHGESMIIPLPAHTVHGWENEKNPWLSATTPRPWQFWHTRGDVPGRQFLAFWLDDEQRVRAGMNVNIWDAGDDIRALIASGRPVDVGRLTDTTVPLSDVAP